MPVFYGAIDLAKNELRNAVIQNLGSAPASPAKGQMYFDTASNTLYYWDGTTWQAVKSGTGGPPTGAAGGALSGTYPNPGLANNSVSSINIVDGVIVVGDLNIGSVRLDTIGAPMGPVSLGSQRITNLATPTASTDGANKLYVDTTAQGLDAKQSVRCATTANIALSGLLTIDGITLASNDRVLVKDQTTPAQNGIYIALSGSWGRAGDADAWTELPAAYVWVEQGTVNADTGWVCTADQGGIIETTAVTWTQFAGAGSIIAGAGLTKTGNSLDVGAGSGITVNADNIQLDTTVAALKSDLTAYAPLASPTFTGDPKAPTAAPGDNDTSIATTAFVTAAVAAAAPVGMAKKFAAALTGTASPEVITHNLNTRDIQLTVLNGATPYTAVEVDWDATTVNTATIRYNPNLGAGYRAVVVG